MDEFLIPSRGSLVSRLEWIGIAVGVALLIASAAVEPAWLSGSLSSGGVAILAGVAGSLIKDFRSRGVLSRYGVDPYTTVYVRRGAYSLLISNIKNAEQVDLLGISLNYALEHICDNAIDFFNRVNRVRILLPATTSICDERDRTQGTPIGSLSRSLRDAVPILESLVATYPGRIEVKYFDTQPYAAVTRIDDIIWVSPYIAKRGSSSPVMVVTRPRSPQLFLVYSDHIRTTWNSAVAKPNLG